VTGLSWGLCGLIGCPGRTGRHALGGWRPVCRSPCRLLSAAQVMNTNLSAYIVRPAVGVVEPGAHRLVEIEARAEAGLSTAGAGQQQNGGGDRFRVQAAFLGTATAAEARWEEVTSSGPWPHAPRYAAYHPPPRVPLILRESVCVRVLSSAEERAQRGGQRTAPDHQEPAGGLGPSRRV
jgi:hypothetical protein